MLNFSFSRTGVVLDFFHPWLLSFHFRLLCILFKLYERDSSLYAVLCTVFYMEIAWNLQPNLKRHAILLLFFQGQNTGILCWATRGQAVDHLHSNKQNCRFSRYVRVGLKLILYGVQICNWKAYSECFFTTRIRRRTLFIRTAEAKSWQPHV
jgi:hypothetical protein